MADSEADWNPKSGVGEGATPRRRARTVRGGPQPDVGIRCRSAVVALKHGSSGRWASLPYGVLAEGWVRVAEASKHRTPNPTNTATVDTPQQPPHSP